MRADGSVTVQWGWNIHRVGQKCSLLTMSILSHRPQAQRVYVCLGYKSFCWTLKNQYTTHVFKLLGTLAFFMDTQMKQFISPCTMSKYRHKKLLLYLGMCTHTVQTNSDTHSQHWHKLTSYVDPRMELNGEETNRHEEFRLKRGEVSWSG